MSLRRLGHGSSVAVLVGVAAALVPLPSPAQPYSFTHLAGGLGGGGMADGTGAGARFLHPGGVARDANGNLLVADVENHAIRMVSPGGVVTTLAGNGAPGDADGTGTAASFSSPRAVAVDASGNVFVADSGNRKIRKVTPAGVVTTLAGGGVSGNADGTGPAASFSGPYGIAVDAAGVLYVADRTNNSIRKVTSSGTVTTLAGGNWGAQDGQGTSAGFIYPTGVAVDSGGFVYVADNWNGKIRKITPGGLVTTLAGTGKTGGADGPGYAATFSLPFGVTVDGAGNVYVAESSGHKVRKVTPDGTVTTLAGSGNPGGADGPAAAAAFGDLTGIVVDPQGKLFVSDSTGHKIRTIEAGVVGTLAGFSNAGYVDGPEPVARFVAPAGVAVDAAGTVYVADSGGFRVRRIEAAGVVSTLAGTGRMGFDDGYGEGAGFSFPTGVAVDASGNVYVADSENSLIRMISPSRDVTTAAGSWVTGYADGSWSTASFNKPTGVAVDASGNVYVADQYNNAVRKISTSRVVTTLAGGGTSGYADGQGSAAKFYRPWGVAVDGAGNVYVADTWNHRIRKVTAGGLVTSLAGSGGAGKRDGTGTGAGFSSPTGVAVDGAGNVFVADTGNHLIRKVTPAGVVTTVGGTGRAGSVDGTATGASFTFPSGIAVDRGGRLVVADAGNAAVRAGQAMGSATCAPDDTHLCLLGGRFRVSSDWGDYTGGKGTGSAVHLTPDTGHFWFFDPANVEAVVKMVAFCGSGGSNVAVYAGGLTDLDVTLHVIDTRNGTAKDYRNPLGTGFALIRDGPFACPAAAESGGGEADGIVEVTPWVGSVPAIDAACAPGATTLCLLGGRFRVTAAYRDYGGWQGMGQAIPLTSDTGYFWFFTSSNVETVVKMVSFCGGGSNNVAVYLGGLTDVEVTLTVTDLQSGLVKSYTNPLGSPFRLVRDGPFPCP